MAQSAGVPRRAGFVEGMLLHVDGGVGCSMPGQIDENIAGEVVVGSTQARGGCFAFVKGIVGVGAPPPVFGHDETLAWATGAVLVLAEFASGQWVWFVVFSKSIAIDFTAGVQTVCAGFTHETKLAVVGALDFTPYTIRTID